MQNRRRHNHKQYPKSAQKVLNDLGQHESEVGEDKGNKYRMRIRPYQTLNNVIEGVVVTFEDISKLKELVDALTESETLWRGLVENAPMGVFIMTEDRFAYLNPEALQIFGVTSQEVMLGKPTLERVHRDSQDIFSKQAQMLIEDRRPVSAVEEKWLRLDCVMTELVISAPPIVFEKQHGALVFVREKI